MEGNAQYLCWVTSIAARVLGEVGVGHAILWHVGVLVPVAHGSVLRWHLLHAWSCKWRLLRTNRSHVSSLSLGQYIHK